MNRGGATGRRARALYVGRYFGIEFYLHYSWFIIAGIVTYELATVIFPNEIDGLARGVYLAMGSVAAGVFFLSILLHELGHSLVSQRCGIPVPRITLLFIGGLAEIAREPDDAKSELKIALGGPAVTLVLVLVFGLAERIFDARDWEGATLVADWLCKTNLALMIFNMFPGYPLDGGRVLRAIIWGYSGRLRRATYITSRIGIAFSWMLLTFGLYLLIIKHQWNAVALVLIGIFLKAAAESGYASAVEREVLGGICVRDLMTAGPAIVPDSLPLNLAVDDYFFKSSREAYPVCCADGEFCGLLRLDAVKRVPRTKWPFTLSREVADQNRSALCIGAGDSAARAMRRLTADSDLLVVIEESRAIGAVARADLLRFIEIRTALEV